MADILPDHGINQLLGKCLLHADKDCVKSNTYECRLGRKARFRNTDEQVELQDGEYLEVGPGETVDLTSVEVVDFLPETVNKVFPGEALMGMLTNRTTLMREGISFASTKIDSGYYGVLDWVFKNNDFRPVLLPFKEPVVNLIIFRLGAKEKPDLPYGVHKTDHYQGSEGLRPSARKLPAQIPDSLIKRQSKKPDDAPRRIRDYGPPISWIGNELDDLSKKLGELGNKMEGVMPSIEAMISGKFTTLLASVFAFALGLAGLSISLLQLLQRYEKEWIPWTVGGLSLILLVVALAMFLTGRKRTESRR
jgi:deoxycytidine triphosphate deaminase